MALFHPFFVETPFREGNVIGLFFDNFSFRVKTGSVVKTGTVIFPSSLITSNTLDPPSFHENRDSMAVIFIY